MTCQRGCGEPVKRTELEPLILRWKKTTRALKIHDQPYGRYITDILELRTDAELARFSDPAEAAAFFCLLEFSKTVWPEGFPLAGRRPVPGQSPLMPGYRMPSPERGRTLAECDRLPADKIA